MEDEILFLIMVFMPLEAQTCDSSVARRSRRSWEDIRFDLRAIRRHSQRR